MLYLKAQKQKEQRQTSLFFKPVCVRPWVSSFGAYLMTDSSPLPGERVHALDGVRATALLLGIVFHATLSFMPGMMFWPANDPAAHTGFSVLFFVSHIFRMSVFFLIAGYFARLSFYKRGGWPFAKSRLSRITLPLVVFWLPIFASIAAVYIWGAIKANGGQVPDTPAPAPSFGLTTFPLTHLWFLWVLSLIYGAFFLIRAAFKLIDHNQWLSRPLDGLITLLFKSHIGLVLFGAPLFLTFGLSEHWMAWLGIQTPDYGLIPNRFAWVGYFTAFTAGWWIHRQTHLLEGLAKVWWIYGVVAIGLTYAALTIVGFNIHPFPLAPLKRWIYAGLYVSAIWSWSFALIGFAFVVWSKGSKIMRYIADSSYWLYLLHLPLIMAWQVWASDKSWPVLVKFSFVILATVIPLWMSYHLLVRYTFIGRWLNGPRTKSKSSQSLDKDLEIA